MSKLTIEPPIKWIMNSAVFITLIFSPTIADPFNSMKFWTLVLCASLISGYALNKKLILELKDIKFYKILKIVIFSFLIFSLISSIYSYNLQISLFGENFRKNGLLTFTALSIFFIVAIKYTRFENLNFIFKRVVIVGALTSSYSILQISKNDFINWSDPNSIISTLGNSNFAGSAMAIFAIVCFGQFFIKSVNHYYKLFNIVVFISLLYSIQKTNARQALFIITIGIITISLIKIFVLSKKFGAITLLALLPIAILTILGILQIGPLEKFMYKGTVSIRGYYWRAGIEMFKTHPLFGVGIDNYGKFFKEYREVGHPLNSGFGITSTNAHNIFIQNFATGGIFVGLLYILIQLIVLYRALNLIKNCRGDNQIKTSVIFAAWLAFQIQSLISIDNIGLSIWGWLFGGVLVGLSLNLNSRHEPISNKLNKSIVINWRHLLPSVSLLIGSIALIVPLYIGERNTFLISPIAASPQKSDLHIKELFDKYSGRALNAKFISNDYKNIVISGLIDMDYKEEAHKELLSINKTDPRNLDTLVLLCSLAEKTGNYAESIKYRKDIARFDPWNAQNYLALAQLYKLTNDPQNMKLMANKILSFASKDPIAEVAKKEFLQSGS